MWYWEKRNHAVTASCWNRPSRNCQRSCRSLGDRAYVGRDRTTTPHKTPPKGKLTQAQKEFNRQVSQKRVFVEHVI
ncbi:transposase family protein [Leptolyngbya sp. AN02str]|uniref:transposase family protein n=1 Tax=Leptolyngbya sp. AN02str TaxID=3423363 RepID=UPI003D31C09C